MLTPIVIASAGSSTASSGSASGSSSAASVSPIVTSSIPATTTISPAPASSTSTRWSPSVTYSAAMRPRDTLPSRRHQATSALRRIVPR